MKITLIGPTAPFKGGISHFSTSLALELKKNNEVQFISWKRRYPSFLYPGKDQKDPKAKIKIKDAQFILDTLNPFSWIKASLQIRKQKADLVVFQWVSPFMSPVFSTVSFISKLFTKTQIMAICHAVRPHEQRKIDPFLTKMFFRFVDRFIVHSKQDLNDLNQLKKNPSAKLSFLPIFKNYPPGRFDIKLKEGLQLNDQVILFFGYVREYKGLINLIKAMPSIIREVDCNLLIVGEFWKNKNEYLILIEKLNLMDRIKIVDEYVPDKKIGDYFAISNVVVIPYISATQSGVVQTSFNFNKPVITTNVGGLSEAVKNDKTGLIVPPNDTKALSDAIIKFFKENKAKKFIHNIKKEKDKFSWKKYIQQIENETHTIYTS